jgi:membrane protein implicated in regulation of membrane protease activity
VSVRVSPISKAAAILLVILGVFTLIAGLSTGVLESTIIGFAITLLGLVLYRLLHRFSKRLDEEIRTGKGPS